MKGVRSMKKQKILSVVMAAAMLSSAAFAGCSSDKGAASSSSAASEDDSGPITLSIAWWGSQSRHDYTNKLLDMYTQLHPNVKFEASPSGWDGYQQKLATEAAGNALPDIMQTDWTFVSDFTQNGSFADLTSYIKDKTIDLSDVASGVVSSGKVNGKDANIPLSVTAEAMSYNPDVFKAAGLSEPTGTWTWSDWENEMLQIYQKTGKFGCGSTYSTSESGGIFTYYLRQNKGNLFASDGTKLGYTDDKFFVNFISTLKKLQDAKALPSLDQWTQISAKGADQLPVALGTAGVNWGWANVPTIVSSVNPNIKLTKIPTDNPSVKSNYLKPGMYFSVSNSSKHKKAAAEFINWFINDVDANKVIMAERGVPASSKARDAIKSSLSTQQQAMFDYIDTLSKDAPDTGSPDPSGASQVYTDLYNAFSAVLYGKSTAEQAAADFRKQANAVLANNS